MAPIYTYGRAEDLVVPRPGDGVGSDNGTPTGGGGNNGGGSSGQTSPMPVSVVRLLWRGVGANDDEVKRREDKQDNTKLTPLMFMRA